MANHLEIRKVTICQQNSVGGYSVVETWEYRTKDVVASVLGLIPLASTWSLWTPVEDVMVYKDQNGNIISNPFA